jgi:hypothetical protein
MRVVASIFILTATVVACMFDPPLYKVSRSFSVHVKNEIGPVAGLKIKVSRFKTDDLKADFRRAAFCRPKRF